VLTGPALTLEDLRSLQAPPRAGDSDVAKPPASHASSEPGLVPT